MSKTSLSLQLIDAHAALRRALRQALARETRDSRFTGGPSQLMILYYIDREGSCTLTRVTELVQVDAAAASRAISTLEKAGFLKKSKDPKDSRSSLLQVTAKGQRAAEEAAAARERLGDRFVQSLNRQEAEELIRLLNKATEGIKLSKEDSP